MQLQQRVFEVVRFVDNNDAAAASHWQQKHTHMCATPPVLQVDAEGGSRLRVKEGLVSKKAREISAVMAVI
jgi:P pilus assembly chaperone PapD